MEGAGDLQGHAALCTGGLGSLTGGIHSGLVARNGHLAGAVVVGNLHHAAGGLSGLGAGGAQRLTVQTQNSGHAAGAAGHGLLHGLAAEGSQGNGGGCVEHTGAAQGGILAQAQARHSGRLDALILQHGGQAGGEGYHAGLGELGLAQGLVRPLKAQLLQIEIHRSVRGIQRGAEQGFTLVKIFAHPGVLSALTGIQNRKFHCVCFLHSAASSSISSRT